MKALLIIALLGFVTFVYSENYAILVAGSDGFSNYRHQSDTCHAYQILVKGGIKPENIIHFAKNDIAQNTRNPFPGKIFNHPDPSGPGVDVYAGCKIDYQGADVTPANFLKVITGKADGKLKKVLTSTASDNVFMYFSDHGAPNLIAFPAGNYLYKKDLWPALKEMQSKKMYKKLTFYIEACESGSMCKEDSLTAGTDIYCLTAANETQSSYAYYCGSEAVVNGKSIGSCLGDEFSIKWMEDVESKPKTMTLQQNFETVKSNTQGSHVLQWCNKAFTGEEIGTFIGYGSKYTDIFTEEAQDIREDNRMTKLNYLKRQMLENIGDKMAAVRYQTELHLHNFVNKVFNTLGKLLGVIDKAGVAEEFDQECYKNLIDIFQDRCQPIPEHGLHNLKIFTHICSKNASLNQKIFGELLKRACVPLKEQTQE